MIRLKKEESDFYLIKGHRKGGLLRYNGTSVFSNSRTVLERAREIVIGIGIIVSTIQKAVGHLTMEGHITGTKLPGELCQYGYRFTYFPTEDDDEEKMKKAFKESGFYLYLSFRSPGIHYYLVK